MKIAIGTDHRGYVLKELIKSKKIFNGKEIHWLDCGAYSDERTDYPVYAKLVANAVQSGKADSGILLCGTGIGMAITANRLTGIRAGVVWSEDVACAAKEDDDVNVIVLPADYVTADEVLLFVSAWITCTFKQGRYAQRIALIDT